MKKNNIIVIFIVLLMAALAIPPVVASLRKNNSTTSITDTNNDNAAYLELIDNLQNQLNDIDSKNTALENRINSIDSSSSHLYQWVFEFSYTKICIYSTKLIYQGSDSNDWILEKYKTNTKIYDGEKSLVDAPLKTLLCFNDYVENLITISTDSHYCAEYYKVNLLYNIYSYAEDGSGGFLVFGYNQTGDEKLEIEWNDELYFRIVQVF